MFDRTRLPAPQNALVATLVDGAFLDRTENVLAFGPPGSGKTHLLCAIAQTLIHQGRRILFTPCNLLVQELLPGQTRSALATPPQTLCQIRCPPPRRYRLRPAQPRRDGSPLRPPGTSLRASKRHDHFKPALLRMGGHLQGPDDHRRGDRPARTSRHHHRYEPQKLPTSNTHKNTTNITTDREF